MVACVANTIWAYENQVVLDQIGFFVLCLGIPVLLMLLRMKEVLVSWESIKDDSKIKAFSNDALGVLEKIFGTFLFMILGFGTFILFILVGSFILNLVFATIILNVSITKILSELLEGLEFICPILFFALVLFLVLNFAFLAIRYIIVSCFLGGILRRFAWDFVLMFLVFVAFTMNFFPEWLVNSLVIISISLFLYDIYRIADLKKEIPQGL